MLLPRHRGGLPHLGVKNGVSNAMVCSRVHELQEALSAATIALEIPSRNARVRALQRRWNRPCTGLDSILQRREADMVEPTEPTHFAW